jgi:regulator of replication initiation timing
MTTTFIKENYQVIIKGIEKDIAEVKANIAELEQIEKKLIKFGLDESQVKVKKWELMEDCNNLISDLEAVKEAMNAELKQFSNSKKQEREDEAVQKGIDSAHKAFEDGSYHAICEYSQKYLQKAWKKGFDLVCQDKGWIPYSIA